MSSASDRPGASRPSWRPAGKSSARRRKAAPRWQRGTDRAVRQRTGWSRAARAVLAAWAFLACGGALVWVALWFHPPRAAALVLLGAGYEENLFLPHNAYGLNSLRALLGPNPEAGTLQPARADVVALTSSSQLFDELGRSNARTTVAVLSMHGASDEKGPFLFLDAPAVGRLPARVYLEALIGRLREMAPRRFVLVLDATQAPAMPPMGVIHNDFAEQLRTLDDAIAAAGNIAVLCASDVDQRSWVSDRWGTTVFGHFLAEGLAGAAVESTSPGSGRIDVEGLWSFVRDKVQRWVYDNRNTAQTPLLLPREGPARSFELGRIEARAPLRGAAQATADPAPIPARWREAWGSAWGAHDELAAGAPAPAVVSPVLWRRYRDWLIRLDELVRADSDRVAAVKVIVDRLRDQVRQALVVKLDSDRNTLAMAAAEGPPVPDSAEFQAEFNRVWTDFESAKDQAPGRPAGKKRAFAGLLLQRVEADATPATIDRASQFMGLNLTPDGPRPVELQLLAMLHRDAPRSPVDPPAHRDLLARLLRVRTFAEQAAIGTRMNVPSYSDRVLPWIAATVQEADAKIRPGQDLAFADDRESWAAASRAIDEAEALYHQALDDARSVGEAVVACDAALADLPYYADWAVHFPSPADPAADPVERVRSLLVRVHELEGLLVPGEPDASGLRRLPGRRVGRPDLGPIVEHAKAIQAGLDRLRLDLSRASEATEPGHPAYVAALATPFPSFKQREELGKRLIDVSPTVRTGGDDRAVDPAAIETVRASATSAAHAARRRRALLAMAVLGRDWFDEAATITLDPRPSDEDDDGQRPASALSSYFDVESLLNSGSAGGAWGEVGRQIAARWQRMPLAFPRYARSLGLSEPGTLHPDQVKADRLGRRMPGFVAGDDPAPAYRARLLQGLLLEQARRTLADHWFAHDARGEPIPYYKTIGQAFLDDARAIDPAHAPQEIGEAKALRDRLAREDRLELAGPGPLDVTSERSVDVEFRLRIPEGSQVPEGRPVVWLAPDPADLFDVDPAALGRHGLAVSRQPVAGDSDARFRTRLGLPLIREVEKDPAKFPRPEERKATVALEGIYRGQSLRQALPVRFHPVPEITNLRYPLPIQGKVAVAAEPALISRFGEGGGSLSIVLDCSGSMAAITSPGRDGAPGLTKYQEATAALRQVLARVSRGTSVSLWVFGQALQPGGDSNAVPAEQTVTQVLPPTNWDPQNSRMIDQLMQRVESPVLTPWNESPIVRTMLRARDDLRDASGYKMLLVLTDGKDNRFEKDIEFNRAKKDIPTAIRDAFGSANIEVNVIGYKVADAEEVEARKQFEVIERLPLPGRFVSVKDAGQLAATLALALRPSLKCSLETMANVPVETLTVARTGDNDRWTDPGLQPGGYKVVVRAGERRERELTLGRGDLLLVRLVERRGTLAIERGLYSDDPRPRTPSERETGWRFDLVRNGRTGRERNGLEVWPTLEKLPSDQESALEMIKPREAWFEVSPAPDPDAPTAATAYAQRWSYRPGLPAPCWSGRSPAWPMNGSTPARPAVKAWWDADQEAPYTSVVVRAADFASTDEIPAREVRAAGATVFIENVAVETRRVEVEPGVEREMSCLVVRLRHEPDRPFWVRTLGLRPEGAEHRFYTRANKYTGVFWPVTRDQADVALEGLGLVSLAEFKARAARRGYVVDHQSAGSPDARDAGPSLVPFPDQLPEPLPAGDRVLR